MDDEVRFDAFVRDCGTRLLRAGWMLTGSWAGAEDLVQTALERTWAKWATIQDPTRAEAYVRTVMTHAFLHDRRRRWSAETPTDPVPDRSSADDLSGPELHVDLLAAVRALPARQRAVITWRYFADLTEIDTAAVMGCSVGAVKSHTWRALHTLRLSPQLFEGEEIG